MLYLRQTDLRCVRGKWEYLYCLRSDADQAATGKANVVRDKPIKGVRAGQVYQVEGSETDEGWEWKPATLRWHSSVGDDGTEAALVQAASTVKAAQDKALREDWRECMAPVREAMRQARGQQRNVLLAQVVAYLTKG